MEVALPPTSDGSNLGVTAMSTERHCDWTEQNHWDMGSPMRLSMVAPRVSLLLLAVGALLPGCRSRESDTGIITAMPGESTSTTGATSEELVSSSQSTSDLGTTSPPTSTEFSASSASDTTTFELDGAVPDKPLCDGSDKMRLAIVLTNPHSSGYAWENFQWQLGIGSTYVRGDCRFWVLRGEASGGAQTVHTGVLTEELAAELAKDMHYSQLNQFDDQYGDGADSDSLFIISDGANVVRCRGRCTETPTAPKQLQDMAFGYDSWRNRLLTMSNPTDGPMWMFLTKGNDASPPEGDCDLSWPFTFDPASVAQVNPADNELRPLLMEGPEAQELRAWWHNNIANPSRCFEYISAGSFLEQEQDESWTLYRLTMRDSIPLENAEGFIPLVNEVQ